MSFSKYFYSVIHLDTALFISNEHLYTWEVIFLVLLGGQSWDRVLVAQSGFRAVMKWGTKLPNAHCREHINYFNRFYS